MAKIVIIHTGGTIAMTAEADAVSVRPGAEHPMHRLAPYLLPFGDIVMDDFLNLPSPHMTPDLMLKLARKVQESLLQPDTAGVVVTHGTDTLEETAFLLNQVIDSPKPVVVTGAMRSSNELGADGPVNLLDSVRTILEPDSRNRGVLVVFNDQIHAARYVSKTHTSSVATFQSPGHGPVGMITKKGIHYTEPPMTRQILPLSRISAEVPLLKAVAGLSLDWFTFKHGEGIDGVVIEAFGAGNVPPSLVPFIQTMCEQNKPVVLVSRCIYGYVQDIYDYEGGGKSLRQLGAVFANGLNGPKARILLIAALSCNYTLEKIRNLFS